MKVSQYIYTACGKEKTGAFSVFSKSRDITNEESAEIREVMMYKTPSGLPYEPTEQQIEELFPKKFGYFFLSSGRACLAQVCYVGRVYSDLDGRFGNYIIHAFVFEKTNNFTPYSFIEHLSFKRMLTRKEWHDDPIPEELPQIEIPETGAMLSMSDITSFLNEDRKNKLKLLIEAVINSSSENPVCLNDEYPNQKYWLKLLSVCLPKTMQNEVSICTHFTNTLMPGNISSRIQIRINQPENSLFSYAQEAQKGRYAFDFMRNIFSASVKPGKYAESIVTLLSLGVFEAVKFVDNINKVMSAYSVNINEASCLINLNRAEYSNFDINGIFDTILIADRVSYETQSIANNLWTNKPKLIFNTQQSLNIFAFIYKNISAINTRIEIIKTIIDNAEQNGIRSKDANVFYSDLNSKANFIFANYLDYLKAEGLANYITQNKNSFPRLFIAFDFLANLPAVRISKDSNTEEFKAIRIIMNLTFKQQSVPDIDLLMNSADSHLNGLGISLLSAEAQGAIKSGIAITNIQFAFETLKRLRPKTESASAFLIYLIKTMSDKDEFINLYINAQKNDPDFYSSFEHEKKGEAMVAEFCKKKEMFRFANQQLNSLVLKNYFDKYYVTGADTGLFVKRLGEYLNAVQPEKRAVESISILDGMKLPINADKALLAPVYCVILEAVFSVPYSRIHEFVKKQEWCDKIIELYKTTRKAGISLKQEARELALIAQCGSILEKYNNEKNQQVFMFFSKLQADDANSLAANFDGITSGKGINTFIEYYIQTVANIFVLGAMIIGNKQYDDYDTILKRVFGKIIENVDLNVFTDNIIDRIKKLKINRPNFILYIFRKHLADSKNTFDMKLGNIAKNYFEKISNGDRKKTFEELLDLAEKTEIEQFERYFEEFTKTHKSGLFGFLKPKK